MKICAFLCTYNDEEYLDAALESFKWFPDKMLIIEGSWKSANQPPRSSQKTYDIIDKHVDNKKVFLTQENRESDTKQRQAGIEFALQNDADWLWLVDSDEIYTKSVIKQIASILKNASPLIKTFRVQSYNFINSFNNWYEGSYSRIYRIKGYPEAKFIQHNDIAHDNTNFWMHEKRMPNHLRFYHYNYVKKNPTSFHVKMDYHGVEVQNFNQTERPKYGYKNGIYTIPSDIPTFKFKGKHPKIMATHPNFVNNIYNDNDLQFLDE